MRAMTRTRRLVLCLAIATGAVLSFVSTAPAVETVAWDQAAVTQLADELANAVRDVRNAVRSEPAAMGGTRAAIGGGRGYHCGLDGGGWGTLLGI